MVSQQVVGCAGAHPQGGGSLASAAGCHRSVRPGGRPIHPLIPFASVLHIPVAERSSGHLPSQAVTLLGLQSAKDENGVEVPLSSYMGKVTIFVNLASKCGYTKTNYEGLTKLYQEYHPKGVEVRRRGAPFPASLPRWPSAQFFTNTVMHVRSFRKHITDRPRNGLGWGAAPSNVVDY